jgi:hypothetical protein
VNRLYDEVIVFEIRALLAATILEVDDAMFRQNTEVAAHLSLVAFDASGEVADRLDFLAAEHVDEFTPLLGQNALGAFVTENVHPSHSTFGECACHFLPSFSTRGLFRARNRFVALIV